MYMDITSKGGLKMNQESFSSRLKTLRRRLKISREAICSMFHRTAKTIKRWEEGSEPPLGDLAWERLAALERAYEAATSPQGLGSVSPLVDLLQSFPQAVQEAVLDAIHATQRLDDRLHKPFLTAQSPSSGQIYAMIRRYFVQHNWQPILDLATFLPWDSLPREDFARVTNMVGVANLYRGTRAAAEACFKAAESAAPASVLADVLTNQSILAARAGRLEDAEALLDRALEVSPGHLPSLFQRVVTASKAEDAQRVSQRAEELAGYYPSARDPGSEIGMALLEDPDLSWFRGTPSFSRAFQALSQSIEVAPMNPIRPNSFSSPTIGAALRTFAMLAALTLSGLGVIEVSRVPGPSTEGGAPRTALEGGGAMKPAGGVTGMGDLAMKPAGGVTGMGDLAMKPAGGKAQPSNTDLGEVG